MKSKLEPELIAAAQDEVCFYAMLLEPKANFSPAMGTDLINKIKGSYAMLPDVVKEGVASAETAKILNAIDEKPGITTEELIKETGLSEAIVNEKLTEVGSTLLTQSGGGYSMVFAHPRGISRGVVKGKRGGKKGPK